MDANLGEPWSEMDISDLTNEIAHGRTIPRRSLEQIAPHGDQQDHRQRHAHKATAPRCSSRVIDPLNAACFQFPSLSVSATIPRAARKKLPTSATAKGPWVNPTAIIVATITRTKTAEPTSSMREVAQFISGSPSRSPSALFVACVPGAVQFPPRVGEAIRGFLYDASLPPNGRCNRVRREG